MDPHSTVAAPSSSEMPEPERSVSPRNVIEAGMQLKATRSVLPTVSSKSVNGILGRSAADNPLQTDKKSMMALIRRSVTMSPSLFRKHTPVSHAASSTAPPSSVQIASAANGIRPSFYWNKAVLSAEERMLAILSAKSLKSDSQDEVCFIPEFAGKQDCTFVGVFDGHGPEGRAAAKFAATFLQGTLKKDIRTFSPDVKKRLQALKNACYACQKKMGDYRQSGFDAYFSGTTATFAVLQQGQLYIANCGDSRAVIGRGKADGSVKAIALTEDAKPEMPTEAKRINKSGGVVAQMTDNMGHRIGPFRVYKRGTEYPGLAMSRSLGDITAHNVGVSAKPDRTHYVIDPQDEFVVFGSDGIWQVLEDQEVVDFVSTYMNARDDTHNCADALTLHAQDMWKHKMEEVIVDDIGVVILHFKELPPVRIKRALHYSNKAATSNDLANQMYRKWERAPHLDPSLVNDKLHFTYLNDPAVKSIIKRAQQKKQAKQAGIPNRVDESSGGPKAADGKGGGVATFKGEALDAAAASTPTRDVESAGNTVMDVLAGTTEEEPVKLVPGDFLSTNLMGSDPGTDLRLKALSAEVLVPPADSPYVLLAQASKTSDTSRTKESSRRAGSLVDNLGKSVRKMAASIRSGKQDEDSRSHQSLNTGGVAGGRADLSLEHQPQVGKQLAGTGLAGSSEDNSSLREAASELFPLPPPHDVNYWLTAYKEELLRPPVEPLGLTYENMDGSVQSGSLGSSGSSAQRASDMAMGQKGRLWGAGKRNTDVEGAVNLAADMECYSHGTSGPRLTQSLLAMHDEAFRQHDRKAT